MEEPGAGPASTGMRKQHQLSVFLSIPCKNVAQMPKFVLTVCKQIRHLETCTNAAELHNLFQLSHDPNNVRLEHFPFQFCWFDGDNADILTVKQCKFYPCLFYLEHSTREQSTDHCPSPVASW